MKISARVGFQFFDMKNHILMHEMSYMSSHYFVLIYAC